MKKDLVFLQNLQNSYANWTGLAVIICSLEGDLLTEISWGNRLTEELYSKFLTKEYLKTFIQPLQLINKTTLLDTDLGSKVIISPVRSNGKETYFIISGFVYDEKTNEMIDNYFKKNPRLSKRKIEFELLSDSEIIKKAESIKNMTEVIASYVSLYEDHSNSQTFSTLISEQIDSINNRTSTVDSILQIGNFFDAVDFMGLALQSAGDLFMVETSIGRYSNALKGYTFTVGEGLLGYSIATKRPEFYGNVENDARLWAFLKINVNVKSLFCFPLIRGDKVIGLLFGGSTEHEIDKMSVFDKLSISASLMVNHLNTQKLVLKTKNQLIEISTFEEIIKVLTTVKDLEKVLFILIDISMNFTRGVFTSIVYRNNPTGNQAKLLSRGADETVCIFLHEAAQKFFSPNFEMKKWDRPLISETPCGINVMELPLVFDDNVYGLLSVGISSGTDLEKCKTVLSGLATAGGIAIHFLRLGDKVRGELNFIELLRKLLLTYEPEKYELAENIKETTLKFAQEVGIYDSISIEKLSLFSVIDRSLVESIIDDQELFLLLGKFERVLDGKSNGNLIAEIIALVWTYYSTNKSLKSIAELKIENKKIQQQFISFINQREIIVTEIMINDKGKNTGIISTKIQDETFHNLNLSAREKEVLNHVIQGCSNKEIAQLLHISDHTVKNHMTHILTKLDVSDRSQAIAKMYQMGYNFTK